MASQLCINPKPVFFWEIRHKQWGITCGDISTKEQKKLCPHQTRVGYSWVINQQYTTTTYLFIKPNRSTDYPLISISPDQKAKAGGPYRAGTGFMNVLLWNCRGSGGSTIRMLNRYLHCTKADLAFVSETRCNDRQAELRIKTLSLNQSVVVPARGNSGGTLVNLGF